MRNIILSIYRENDLSFVSASDKISQVEFSTEKANIFILLCIVRYKLLKERIKYVTNIVFTN